MSATHTYIGHWSARASTLAAEPVTAWLPAWCRAWPGPESRVRWIVMMGAAGAGAGRVLGVTLGVGWHYSPQLLQA